MQERKKGMVAGKEMAWQAEWVEGKGQGMGCRSRIMNAHTHTHREVEEGLPRTGKGGVCSCLTRHVPNQPTGMRYGWHASKCSLGRMSSL